MPFLFEKSVYISLGVLGNKRTYLLYTHTYARVYAQTHTYNITAFKILHQTIHCTYIKHVTKQESE